LIKINDLSKRYGNLNVLKSIDFELDNGKVYAIVGPNASGKTTLIKCILGLVKPDYGVIEINNEKINGQCQYRRNIGYMPQMARFPENLSAKEVLHLVRDIRGNPEKTDTELLEKFKIENELEKPLKNLSGGTKQKISAILAFLFKPQTLILDEPTAGLDPIASSILKDKIFNEKEQGKTFIITSHIMSEVEELATEIIFLLDGKIYFQGSIEKFRIHTQEQKLERAIASIMESL
jgi:Cu-processing system ATP-binding protein